MEWPKRVRTADWENGVLILDGEKKFDIPELTTEIMERLAGYALVAFRFFPQCQNFATYFWTEMLVSTAAVCLFCKITSSIL